MRVLVIEDERRMAELLAQGIREEGHTVTVAHDGKIGFESARASAFDAIVLDLMLPEMDGFTVARRLREERNQTPILMLTARDSEEDTVHGLNLGADDYLTKPFSFEVFLARLRAIARRGPIAAPVCLQVSNLVINTATRQAIRAGRPLALTLREFNILELLAKSSPRVLSREAILETIWGHDGDVTANNLEAFIHSLRGKVERPGEQRLIQTVRGVGYALRTEAA